MFFGNQEKLKSFLQLIVEKSLNLYHNFQRMGLHLQKNSSQPTAKTKKTYYISILKKHQFYYDFETFKTSTKPLKSIFVTLFL